MKIGDTYLITADNWFFAPDGENYRAVYGTVHGVIDSENALGIKTNRNSTNWYVAVGDMIMAGCQVHYAVRADRYDPAAPTAEIDHDGKRHVDRCGTSRIYDANASGLTAFGASQSN